MAFRVDYKVKNISKASVLISSCRLLCYMPTQQKLFETPCVPILGDPTLPTFFVEGTEVTVGLHLQS